MAEAVVEDRPQPSQRFYCHLCSAEVHIVNSDYTCPICSGGFIEELPASSEQSSEDVEMAESNGIDNLDMIRNELATLLMARRGGQPLDPEPVEDEQPGNGGGRGRRRIRHRRMQNIDRFDNILLEILQTLSGSNESTFGNASMFFMGNPGDYAWGREGIDTIVTQLLNQMDTTGPPPLPKDKIDEIPNVEITQEQVDHKLQCSVCWEDFKLNESVRKLPCLHVYHQNCIVPWLELHGTCPICRKSLTPEAPDVTNSLRNVASAFMRSSSEDSVVNTNNSTPSSTNISSSQPDLPTAENDPIQNALSLSRFFTPPGTSGQTGVPSLTTFLSPQNAVFLRPSTESRTDTSNNERNDGSGSGGSTANNSRANNSQNDVFKYDDGNVDFDFD